MPGRYIIVACTPMDETPEDLERIRREAEEIDVHQYQRRFRALKAIGLGAAAAGLVWLVMIMVDSRRNPCERVRDHLCRASTKTPAECKMYGDIVKESVEDDSPAMRQSIRSQCQTKIERLKSEDGVTVP
jgi:hypothetical protein